MAKNYLLTLGIVLVIITAAVVVDTDAAFVVALLLSAAVIYGLVARPEIKAARDQKKVDDAFRRHAKSL
jgi:archaellum biogenesis protein FlaJ (TadC family)